LRSQRLDRRIDESGVRTRGSVAAEFAIILPVLAFLLFAILQYAIVFNRSQAVHAAAREGARVGSLPSTSSAQACTAALDALDGVNFESTPSCATDDDCDSTEEFKVTLTTSYTVNAVFYSDTINLSGEGIFRCE